MINGKKTVYISGKVTGTTDYEERFAKAEAEIEKRGFVALNPIKVHAGIPDGAPYELYMAVSFALIDYADLILMLPDWRDSPGAIREHDFAKAYGIEIMEMDEFTSDIPDKDKLLGDLISRISAIMIDENHIQYTPSEIEYILRKHADALYEYI